MITRETKVSINYFHQQELSYHEIARKTGHDRRTVKRYSENPELIGQPRKRAPRPSKLDEYVPLIGNWLKDDPGYKGSWILDKLRKHGYDGGKTIVSDFVQKLKEDNRRIAYIRFETEPGRQAQVDFGDFKVVNSDGSERTLYKFSMILGYSLGIYCEYLMALPPTQCDVSLRLYRKVQKDCAISVDGSRYEVPHTLVGKKIIVRMKDGILRIFDGGTPMATLTRSDQRGKLIRLSGLRVAIRADRVMNARKCAQPQKGEGKSNIGPIKENSKRIPSSPQTKRSMNGLSCSMIL